MLLVLGLFGHTPRAGEIGPALFADGLCGLAALIGIVLFLALAMPWPASSGAVASSLAISTGDDRR